jgi:hypothetical protein
MLLRLTVPLLASLVLLLASAPTAAAEAYRVSVTRVDSRAYLDHMSRTVLLTIACYEYVYWDNAVLLVDTARRTGELVFSNGRRCSIHSAYRPNATLSLVADDLYRDSQSGSYVRTFACYQYVCGQPRIMRSRIVSAGYRLPRDSPVPTALSRPSPTRLRPPIG